MLRFGGHAGSEPSSMARSRKRCITVSAASPTVESVGEAFPSRHLRILQLTAKFVASSTTLIYKNGPSLCASSLWPCLLQRCTPRCSSRPQRIRLLRVPPHRNLRAREDPRKPERRHWSRDVSRRHRCHSDMGRHSHSRLNGLKGKTGREYCNYHRTFNCYA